MQQEVYFARHVPQVGYMVREGTSGPEWLIRTQDSSYEAMRAERLFRAWRLVVETESSDDWVPFAVIINKEHVVIGTAAVRAAMALNR